MLISADYMILGSGPVGLFLGAELRRMNKSMIIISSSGKNEATLASHLPVLYECNLNLVSSRDGFTFADTSGKRYQARKIFVACTADEMAVIHQLPQAPTDEDHALWHTGLFYAADFQLAQALVSWFEPRNDEFTSEEESWAPTLFLPTSPALFGEAVQADSRCVGV